MQRWNFVWTTLSKLNAWKHSKYCTLCATRAFISHTSIDKLIYQIYQLVSGFPAKILSSCISQNILFHMIGNKSLHFIFWNWAFPILVFTFKKKRICLHLQCIKPTSKSGPKIVWDRKDSWEWRNIKMIRQGSFQFPQRMLTNSLFY